MPIKFYVNHQIEQVKTLSMLEFLNHINSLVSKRLLYGFFLTDSHTAEETLDLFLPGVFQDQLTQTTVEEEFKVFICIGSLTKSMSLGSHEYL